MAPVLKRILQMRVILLSRFAAPGNLQARLISGEQLGIALAIRLPDTCAIGARRQYVRPRMRRDTVAEAAIGQGCPPDTISSDIHVVSGNTPGMPYLTWVMSKFLGLGFLLEEVVAMATVNPARVINRLPKLGTLQVGAPGDVAIMELVEEPVSFVDTRNNTRTGMLHLQPVRTVTAGVPFGRPYNLPFSVR